MTDHLKQALVDPDYLKFLDSLKEEENKGTESKEIGDGMSHIERLENRLALVTGISRLVEKGGREFYINRCIQ